MAKRRVDLTEWFDKVDLGVDSIGNWNDFEKGAYKQVISKGTSTK